MNSVTELAVALIAIIALYSSASTAHVLNGENSMKSIN